MSVLTVLRAALAAISVAVMFGSLPLHAFPTNTVKIIVPFPAGGSTDILAREIAQGLAEIWKQAVVVDNRPGAGSMTGTNAAANAAPDGHTLLMVSAHFAINPSLHANPGYDPLKSFAPVMLVANVPILVVGSKGLPISTIAELVAYAKANPGKLNYGSSGNGGAAHLSAEMFKHMAGVDIVHVPYRGAGPAMTDLIGNHVQLMFDGVSTAIQNVRAGLIKPLAWAGPTRTAILPDLPTVSEAGVPGYSATSWFGILAPAGTPPELVTKINADISSVLTRPGFKERQLDLGLEITTTQPPEFSDFIKSEMQKWGTVIKAANVVAN